MIFDTPKREFTVYETPSPSNISSSTSASNISDKSLVKSILDKHIAGLKTKPSQYDTVYGVRNEKFLNSKKTYVGNLEVRFKNGNKKKVKLSKSFYKSLLYCLSYTSYFLHYIF